MNLFHNFFYFVNNILGDIMNILITGAASGIAFSTMKKINDSDKLYLTVHSKNQIKRLKEKFKDRDNVEIFKLDVTNAWDRRKVKRLDIDVFISNAAIGEGGSIIDIDFDRVRENYEVNVFSNFELIQLVLSDMIKKDSGRIIIMSSLASQIILPFLGSYTSSKSSISTLGLTLQKEVRKVSNNIYISVVEPGCYHTGFNQVMLNNKYYYMDKYSIFYNKIDEIYKKENFIFKMIERKNLRTVTSKLIDIIYCDEPKPLYRVPVDQSLFTKLYMLFKR